MPTSVRAQLRVRVHRLPAACSSISCSYEGGRAEQTWHEAVHVRQLGTASGHRAARASDHRAEAVRQQLVLAFVRAPVLVCRLMI